MFINNQELAGIVALWFPWRPCDVQSSGDKAMLTCMSVKQSPATPRRGASDNTTDIAPE